MDQGDENGDPTPLAGGWTETLVGCRVETVNIFPGEVGTWVASLAFEG